MSASSQKSVARRLLIASLACVGLFGVFVVMTWPMILGETKELTGLDFELVEVSCFDVTGVRGEGAIAWVYQIPESVAIRLKEPDYPLEDYPKWSALRFDGYRQIRWTPAGKFNSQEALLVMKSVFGRAFSVDTKLEQIRSRAGATNYAKWLLSQDGTYVSCWYYMMDEHGISNYYVYVLNLEKRVLVKLSLLT